LSFFKKGHKVKLQLGFKRRYDFDPEPAIAIMQNIVDRLTSVAYIDGDVKFSNMRYATQLMAPKSGKTPKNARQEVGAPREEIEKIRKEAMAMREGKNPEDIEDEPEFLDMEDDKEDAAEESEEDFKSLQDQLHEQFLSRKTKGSKGPAPRTSAPPRPAASKTSAPPAASVPGKASKPAKSAEQPSGQGSASAQPKSKWSTQSRPE
jgi:hypothetical protein